MTKKTFTYKNLLLFDDLEYDDDFFDSAEWDEQLEYYKTTLMRLQRTKNGDKIKLFRIRSAKPVDARWVMPGEKIVFGSYKITAGFFYFGTNMPSESDYSRNFASLVNPNISIPKKKKLDPKHNMIPNIVDYAELTGIQRRRYVLWHSDGRVGQNIEDWFAMLFLYGLERRVFIDRPRGVVKRDELILIREEVRRLLALYGDKSSLIRRAYSEFLACIELECADQKLYDYPVPYFKHKNYKNNDVFTAYINTALIQCADERVPLPADLAYHWYIHISEPRKSDIAVKCEEEFRKLFMIRYTETYGRGITVTKTGSAAPLPIDFCYHKPECDGLRYTRFRLRYRKASIPSQDASIGKLKSIASRCADELAFYSGRQTKSGTAVKTMFALPPVLWSGDEAAALLRLKEAIKNKMYLMYMDELKKEFFNLTPFSKSSLLDFAYSLETENIAMEPDIISFPDLAGDKFIFHLLKNKIPEPRVNMPYHFCRRITELAVSAYMLCNPGKTTFKLYFPIKLDDYFYERLKGYTLLLMRDPPSLLQCIRRLRVNDENDKQHIIRYIRDYIFEDCNTSYEAISVIEKLYKGFGFSKEKLYSDLHSGNVSAPSTKNAGVNLNKEKIKQLREDSDHVSSMLSDIFRDDEAAECASPKTDSKQETAGHFNFDKAETNFLKTILSRAEWGREELAEKARQQGLLLDGFMEIVNEAAYNEFDEALIEGDEIITVNTDIAGMMTEKL